MSLKATYQDKPERGFSAVYKTDTPGCEPYYELRFGDELTIFIDPDRMKALEDVLAIAQAQRVHLGEVA